MTIESFDVLSEAEYIKITNHDNQQPIPTANESSEPTDDDISLAPFLLETRSRRKRSVPLRLAQDYIMLWPSQFRTTCVYIKFFVSLSRYNVDVVLGIDVLSYLKCLSMYVYICRIIGIILDAEIN